jgi:hypothetical protein
LQKNRLGDGVEPSSRAGEAWINPFLDFFVEKSFRGREIAEFPPICPPACGPDVTVSRPPQLCPLLTIVREIEL